MARPIAEVSPFSHQLVILTPRSGSKRQKIYNAIKLFGGMTDEEIERTLEMSGNTVRPSRVSLVRDALVMDSGRTRKTISGNDAIVWVAC